MCGIVALVTTKTDCLDSSVREMTATLTHRGPDDAGWAIHPDEGFALGMRRLSIIDIAGGHQPIWDEAFNHGTVFNGEIYNFHELREELSRRGHTFRTDHSDTEVLVHGYEEWATDLFPRLDGMFAVALWDRPNRRLVVARDRTGEKPLYVAKLRHGYAVASELKALLVHREVSSELDFVALEQYLSFDYIISPRTILTNIYKVPAAHFAFIRADSYEPRRYWSPDFSTQMCSEDEAVARLDDLLDKSVSTRLLADVPVGLFLSGGLDSTTVGYYMRKHTSNVHSFSIGFEDHSFDESGYARMAAKALGTEHHMEVFSESQIKELVPRAADIIDEPMADQSIFPTYLLSRFARQTVKVALGGDGSDELLMGYGTYKALKMLWMLDRLPARSRHVLAELGKGLPEAIGGRKLRGKRFLETLDLAPIPRLLNSLGTYRGNGRSVLSEDVRSNLPASVFAEPVRSLSGDLDLTSAAHESVAAYLRGYLQEDILVKVDRASMAVSLEVRSPFLGPELISFLMRVPETLKLRGMTGKYLLRRLMRGRIPDQIIERKKHGFGVPLDSWLRRSLAPLVRQYLDPGALRAGGIFDPSAVALIVEDHLSGKRNRGHEVWSLLLFELWRERWLKCPSPWNRA